MERRKFPHTNPNREKSPSSSHIFSFPPSLFWQRKGAKVCVASRVNQPFAASCSRALGQINFRLKLRSCGRICWEWYYPLPVCSGTVCTGRNPGLALKTRLVATALSLQTADWLDLTAGASRDWAPPWQGGSEVSSATSISGLFRLRRLEQARCSVPVDGITEVSGLMHTVTWSTCGASLY